MTAEELNKLVGYLQWEQRNYNYLDPLEGGLYSEDFITDFRKFGEQFVDNE